MSPPKPGQTILLVEDDPMVRSLLSQYFRKQNWLVVEAATGEEALALFRKRDSAFGVVIADVHLPGMSGLDLALLVRDQRPAQPIVFVTGDSDRKVAERVLKHEGAGYLLKPFEFFELDAAVRQAVLGTATTSPAIAPPATPDGRTRSPSDWKIQQQRLLENAARIPVDLQLSGAPRRRPFTNRELIVRVLITIGVLVLLAWVIGYWLGGLSHRDPTAPADRTTRTTPPVNTPYPPPRRR